MAAIDPIDSQTFCLLCAAAGVPNSKWQAAWTAISGTIPGPPSITTIATVDSAIRSWWKGQGGVILGTALIVTGILNG